MIVPARDRWCRRHLATTALLLAVTAVPFATSSANDALATWLPISEELRIRLQAGRDIAIEVAVDEDGAESWEQIARRLCDDPTRGEALGAWNGRAAPQPGGWARVPYSLLSTDYRRLAMTTLFPEDRADGPDWIHVARSGPPSVYDESLWQVAEWYTGRGDNFAALMQANGLTSPELAEGQNIRIPAAVLHPAFRARQRSDDASLVYDRDQHGDYAGYELKPGEALYSAVVVRFTGRTVAEDVIETAGLLAERSGIPDLTDIPVGYRIKIPFDLLEPQFLPADAPRRVQAEERAAALKREMAQRPVERSRGLEGVVVIIDPGHGGRDLGTSKSGIWEHDYVYDVACRLRQRLMRETSARVEMTLQDTETGYTPVDTDTLKANRNGRILTDPPFPITKEGDAKTAVNLRWYLANAIYRRALDDGISPDRVVFLSLHADSRHPSLRGLMVYVPGADYRAGRYGFTSARYRRFAEAREQAMVRFSRKERTRSEAISSQLAKVVVSSFEEKKLPVQPHQPVRNRIIRGRSKWIPAVIRGNQVPTKVLVEMLNLSNRDDGKMMKRASERQRLADALVNALLEHFGEN